MSWPVNRKWRTRMRMRFSLTPEDLHELLRLYRDTKMTVQDESELLGASKQYQIAKFIEKIAPQMLESYAERELTRMMGPVRGAYFDVGVHRYPSVDRGEQW